MNEIDQIKSLVDDLHFILHYAVRFNVYKDKEDLIQLDKLKTQFKLKVKQWK